MANSKRKCRHCKEHKTVSDGIAINNGFYCSIEHAQQYATANAAKARERTAKKALSERRSKDRKRKQELKTLPQLIKEAEVACNSYIRARDKNKPCVSCENPLIAGFRGGKFDAGHYRSKGAAKHLRFNLLNIWGQCKHCNNYLSGNIIPYRIELLERIGEARLLEIEHNNDVRRYSREWLQRFTKIMKRRAKHYSRND